LFYGSYIRSQVPASGGALIVPHTTTDKSVGYPGQYQTLTDPDTAAVGFGWQVYMFKKDLGEPPGVGTGDALDSWNDIAVESEGANYLDPTDHHVVTTEVGALFVYFNGALLSGAPLVDAANGLKLQTPLAGISQAGPSAKARFGRAAVALAWPFT